MESLINNQPKVFKSMVLGEGHGVMPIIKYVSTDTDNVVRLLIAGTCPACEMRFMRNTCNARYCKEVMNPVLAKLFPGQLSRVKPVLTHDSDLVEVVTRFDFRMVFPLKSDEPNPFHSVRNFIMDKHPDVDGWIKTSTVKQGHEDINYNEEVSRDTVVSKYNIYWTIDTYTIVYLNDGSFAKGPDEIAEAMTLRSFHHMLQLRIYKECPH